MSFLLVNAIVNMDAFEKWAKVVNLFRNFSEVLRVGNIRKLQVLKRKVEKELNTSLNSQNLVQDFFEALRAAKERYETDINTAIDDSNAILVQLKAERDIDQFIQEMEWNLDMLRKKKAAKAEFEALMGYIDDHDLEWLHNWGKLRKRSRVLMSTVLQSLQEWILRVENAYNGQYGVYEFVPSVVDQIGSDLSKRTSAFQDVMYNTPSPKDRFDELEKVGHVVDSMSYLTDSLVVFYL